MLRFLLPILSVSSAVSLAARLTFWLMGTLKHEGFSVFITSLLTVVYGWYGFISPPPDKKVKGK